LTLGFVALVAFDCSLCVSSVASTLAISPLSIVLSPGQASTTIEVQNRGGFPAAIQARAYGWRQVGDADLLAPTQDLILSPPIFIVAPGASQTLRLLQRGGIRSGGERDYRLLLTEVPPPNTGNKIALALRVSLPVIADVDSAARAGLQWAVQRGPGGETVVTAVNSGQAYDRVETIDVTLPDGRAAKLVALGNNSYILPGARRGWVVLGGESQAGALRFSVTTHEGKLEQTLLSP
jgi:fimbrial chaperone protein